MSATWVALGCVAALIGTGMAAVGGARKPLARPAVYGASLILCLVGLVNAVPGVDGTPESIVLPLGLPWLGARFGIDGLAAFFLVIINLGGAAISLFAMGYARHEMQPQRVLPFFPVFLAALNLVVMAQDAFVFLLSWEFMSLSSWALVLVDQQKGDTRRAAYIYLAMASFGTLCLLLAFGLLSGTSGDYAFEGIRNREVGEAAAAAILVLATIGAGSKAGLVPLHVWLPLAHPAAPSHVSALLSGVMTKIAVYAYLRLVFDLSGDPTWWSCLLPLILGGITAALGVLHGLMQRDLKRLLAYSTIENIGVIFVGLGLALAFRANNMTVAAALALTAALLHALNHTAMKSLLFSISGAILNATGSKDLERLGGLIHRMPVTSVCFLIGAMAISALPPLNGFVSEWLVFQAILQSPQIPVWTLKLIIPATGVLLALAAALAAACFVRAFGFACLGRPRSSMAEQARDVDDWQKSALVILAGLCVLLGIVPSVILDWLQPAIEPLAGARLMSQLNQPWLTLVPVADETASYNGLLVFLFIGFGALGGAMAIHRLASRRMRRSDAWDCGFPDPSPVTQYSADSFAQPIRRLFGTLLFRAREQVDMPPPGDNRPARFEVESRDLVWDWLYAPIGGWVGAIAGRLNELQFLTIRRYLALVFGALVTLLLVLALWS